MHTFMTTHTHTPALTVPHTAASVSSPLTAGSLWAGLSSEDSWAPHWHTMSSGCRENPAAPWMLAAAAPCGALIPTLLSLRMQTDSVVLWGEMRVCTRVRVVTHTHTHVEAQTHTHWVPLMMIIRAFRGCPWRQAGDWGVIFTLKRPMIGSDCDNDHHYCHYSIKWLTGRRTFLKGALILCCGWDGF